MLKSLLILLFVSQAAVAFATPESAANGWTRIETQNFEFVGDASEVSMRDAAERLERFREALSRVLPIGARSAKTRVFLFKDSVSFRPFKPVSRDGTPDEKVRGLFVNGDDFNCIALSADNIDLGTIFHEYVHDVIATEFGSAKVPPWLNEGLATYFQTFRMAGEDTATFGTPRADYLALLRSNPTIPWAEFFALDNFTLHRENVNARPVFYAQAWALTTYLIAHSDRTHGSPKQMMSPSSLMAAAAKLDRATLNERLAFAGTPDAIRSIGFAGAPPLYRVISSPILEAEFTALLGDLLFRLRNPAAETYLKRAAELDPKLASPFTTLGQLRMREQKFVAAKAALEKANSLDSQNYLSHYFYAFLLVRENLDEAAMLRPLSSETAAKIRASLKRSVALNRGFADSHNLLASVELSVGDLPAAESSIRRAIDLKPGNSNYSLLLARILLRQERVDEAVTIASRLTSAEARIAVEAKAILKSAAEIAAAKRSAGDDRQLRLAGGRKIEVLNFADLTPEQVAKIDQDRDNYNYNVMIDRPGADEAYVLGYVERVDCVNDDIEFRVKAGSARLILTTKRFDDVRYRVAVPGTRSYAFRCGTRFPNDLAMVVYQASRAKSTRAGEIKAITFVPPDFEYLTSQQLQDSTYYVVEGRPSVDISQNETIAVKEREEMEREMHETRVRDIEERLRQPQQGEERTIGVPEKLECKSGRMNLSVRVGEVHRVYSTIIAKPFELNSFNSGAQVLEVGCLAQLPPLPAVITFRTAGSELVSVEFVPSFFKLR